MTTEQEKKCEELYREYERLSRSTKMHTESYVSGKSYESQAINQDEILRREEIRKKLLEQCRDFLESKLDPDKFFELENG